MKKRVSILIYSLASGGAERVVSILLYELKNKYDITLFLMNDTLFYDMPSDINIVYLEKSNPLENGVKKLLKLPFLAWKYKKLNNHSDISFSLMNRPNYINTLAKMMGMRSKVIVSERAMPSLQHAYGLQGRINRFLIKSLYNKADLVTANSLGNSADLRENFSCEDVRTINNPFDIELIQKLSREEVTLNGDKFIFMTVGRLDSGKNHKLLINAMCDIDAVLYIIGEGELKQELQNTIDESDLHEKVTLLGRLENPYKYLSKANCFVFASKREGFPNVLVEALACGLPVISTDCKSGPREILDPNGDVNVKLLDDIELVKYGVLIPVDNEELLKKSMSLIMKDDILRDSYKKEAKTRANDFNKYQTLKKWFSIFDMV